MEKFLSLQSLNENMEKHTNDTAPHYRVLFVCLGNICRSPAAEGIMRHLLRERGLTDRMEVDSAGFYGGHAGSLPDPRMRAHAARRGYLLEHHARCIGAGDFERFDLVIGMDDANIDDLRELAPDLAASSKIHRMTEYCRNYPHDHVPDPYYSGADGFELVLNLLEDACAGLLETLFPDSSCTKD